MTIPWKDGYIILHLRDLGIKFVRAGDSLKMCCCVGDIAVRWAPNYSMDQL